jgi:hypothetical protein
MNRDDEEWVDGVPPEGRHTKEQADPAHWQRQWKAPRIVFGVLGLMAAVVLILALAG